MALSATLATGLSDSLNSGGPITAAPDATIAAF